MAVELQWVTLRANSYLRLLSLLLVLQAGVWHTGPAWGTGQALDIDSLAREVRQAINQFSDQPMGYQEEFYGDQSHDDDSELPNEVCAHVTEGTSMANSVAADHGCSVYEVKGLGNMYCFVQGKHRREKRSMDHFKRMMEDGRLQDPQLQSLLKREKRDLMPRLMSKGDDPKPPEFTDEDSRFNDPSYKNQWYMREVYNTTGAHMLSLNVAKAWTLGYTGKGVSVSIIDDGIQWNHTDLQDNYDPMSSYDFNDNDTDPMPQWNDDNKHGTRCAGEVAMVANNSFCGVGIAYNANIGGLRILDGPITDALEAQALSYNIDHIDIFSASWGPTDDGRTVDGPGKLATKAIRKGIREGRNGKGTIYIWASGNGGVFGDDCECDGYADSIYTLSVSGTAQDGSSPWYGEACPSTMTTAYSSGGRGEQRIEMGQHGQRTVLCRAGSNQMEKSAEPYNSKIREYLVPGSIA